MSTYQSTSIEVSKHCVHQLLSSGARAPFVIPEYQRPYAWEEDEIRTLLDDLRTFALSPEGNPACQDSSYFLGAIVCYLNEDNEQEIIDGQQRITSLFLLLRAIYTKLDAGQVQPGSDEEQKKTVALGNIRSALWQLAPLTNEVNYQKCLISSRVISEEQNGVLQRILETGQTERGYKDQYSRNYRFIQKILDEWARNDPMFFYPFIHVVLYKALMLPIIAKSQDMALTIFSTMNNRGMQLSDADIFKAQIYHYSEGSESKASFIQQWKDMDERCAAIGESIQKLFTYYMFFLKAEKGNSDSTLMATRRFYAEDHFAALKQENLMERLDLILQFMEFLSKMYAYDSDKAWNDWQWTKNLGIRKRLDILKNYPNEYWKYPILIFFLCHRDKADFEEKFDAFLKKFIQYMLTKYLVSPTVNAIKHGVMKLDVRVFKDTHPSFKDIAAAEDTWRENIITPHGKAVRMLLLLQAYAHAEQEKMLPNTWEIEHILPKKWQPTYFTNTPKEEIDSLIEHIGNKTPFEKVLNIVASNNYMDSKKKEYAKSGIAMTFKLSSFPSHDWREDNIEHRDQECRNRIIQVLDNWDEEYLTPEEREAAETALTKEEEALLEKLLRKREAHSGASNT